MFVVVGFYKDAAPTVLGGGSEGGSETKTSAFKSGRGDGAGGEGDVPGVGGESAENTPAPPKSRIDEPLVGVRMWL